MTPIMDRLFSVLVWMWTHWFLTTLLLVTVLVCENYRRMLSKLATTGLKGPRPLPIFGNLLTFVSDPTVMYIRMKEMVDKYGDRFCMYIMGAACVVTSNPEDLKEIFVKQFEKFQDRTSSMRDDTPEPFASALTRAQGTRWKNLRSAMSPAFTSGQLRKMMFIMNRACTTLRQKVEKAADKKETFDIGSWLVPFVLEVTISASFGVATDPQIDDQDKIVDYARKAMKPPSKILGLVMLIPFFGSILKRHLLISKYGFDAADIIRVTKDIMAQRRQAKAENSDAVRYDILHVMLETQNEEAKGYHMTDNEILGQSITFLLAGKETTWSTISLVVYHLTIYPEHQQKVRQELDRIVKKDEALTYEHLQEMVYLEACISETLRLYPPGSVTSRRVTQAATLGDNIPVDKGTMIIVPIYAMHRDPRYWEEPDKFIPERFLPGKKESIDPYVYMPFGQGPRHCVGMRFALMEIKSAVSSIFRYFDVAPAPDLHIPIKVGTRSLLQPLEPLTVTVTSRF